MALRVPDRTATMPLAVNVKLINAAKRVLRLWGWLCALFVGFCGVVSLAAIPHAIGKIMGVTFVSVAALVAYFLFQTRRKRPKREKVSAFDRL